MMLQLRMVLCASAARIWAAQFTIALEKAAALSSNDGVGSLEELAIVVDVFGSVKDGNSQGELDELPDVLTGKTTALVPSLPVPTIAVCRGEYIQGIDLVPLLLADSVLAVDGTEIDAAAFVGSLALQACAAERFGVTGSSGCYNLARS